MRKKEHGDKPQGGISKTVEEIFGVKIELNSNLEAIIDGLSNVTDYYDDRIKFNLGNKSVTFEGKGLQVVSYYDSSAIIRGEIIKIEFGS